MKSLKIVFRALLLGLLLASSLSAVGPIYGPEEPQEEPLEQGEGVESIPIMRDSQESRKAAAIAKEDHPDFLYFEKFVQPSSCTLETLKCPPLTQRYSTDHVSLVNHVSPSQGMVSCSIYTLDNLQSNRASPIYSQTFRAEICQSEFSPKSNFEENDEIQRALLISKKRDEEMLEIKYQFTQDFQNVGEDKYLNLSDWLTALITLDGEKLDLSRTLESGKINLKPGFTVVGNDTLLSNFEAAIKNLWEARAKVDQSPLSQGEIDAILMQNEMTQKQALAIADSSYTGFARFWLEVEPYLHEILNLLLIFIITYTIFNWTGEHFSARASGFRPQENHVYRGLFGIGVFLMFFVGSTERIEIDSGDGSTRLVEHHNARIQQYIRELYGWSNQISDNISKIAISSFLSSASFTSGMNSQKEIKALSGEKNALIKENEWLKMLEHSQCATTFNNLELEQTIKNHRNTTKEKSVLEINHSVEKNNEKYREFQSQYDIYGNLRPEMVKADFSFDPIKINPYPKSEREAHRSVFPGVAYSTSRFLNSPISAGNNYMSLSSCNLIINKILQNNGTINSIDNQLDIVHSDDSYQYRLEKTKTATSMLHRAQAEFGHLSVIFLPATNFLLKNDKDFQKIEEAQKFESAEDDFILRKITETLPYLMLLNGNGLSDMLNAGLGGTILTKPLAMWGAAELIKEALEVITILLFVAGGTIAFLLLFIQKMWSFISLPFLAVWSFHKNQHEKIMDGMAKVIVLSIKSILLVISIYLSLFTLSMAEQFQTIMMSFFLDTLPSDVLVEPQKGWFWDTWSPVTQGIKEFFLNITNFLIKGFGDVVFAVVKILLAYQVIFKFPDYVLELLSINSQDLGSKMSDMAEETARRETMRGL